MTWGLYSGSEVLVDDGPLDVLLKRHRRYRWSIEYIAGNDFVIIGIAQDDTDCVCVKLKEISGEQKAKRSAIEEEDEEAAPETKRSIPPGAYADRTASISDAGS